MLAPQLKQKVFYGEAPVFGPKCSLAVAPVADFLFFFFAFPSRQYVAMAERQTPPIDPELLRFEAEAQAAAQAETQAEALSEAPSEAQWETLPSRKRKSSCSSDEHEPRAAKKRLSAETWETKRTIITKLYQEEKRPLKEVMEIMQRDYQFSAT